MGRIKSDRREIVFQEIPTEVSLCIYVSGCNRGCPGCHSKWLWNDVGEDVENNLVDWIEPYKDAISCVLFMGGDCAGQDNLLSCLKMVKSMGLKTALYSGASLYNIDQNLVHYLNYLKVGEYVEELGGLRSEKTNQRLYRLEDDELIDITKSFWVKRS